MLRFAPSPTGDMHIGNLRAAVFNYIVSKQLKDDLLIRIEDTDKERNIDGKDKEILELLTIFSLDYKNVFYQSQNLKYHQKLALQLMSQKKAFACFCTDERLEQLKEKCIKEGKPFRYDGFCEHLSDHEVVNSNKPFTVRIKKPLESIKFTDLLKGDFEYAAFDIDSFILLRQDKTPTYNFACSVDDMIMNISTVIRGEDHVSNTPRQIHVRNSLNYTKNINYVHLPIILNAQTGKKMSKRDNESSVKWLINEGYLPSAIANYLVLLGNKTQKEIFTLEEAIEWFKIESISKSAAKFDIDKLKFINRKHIENIDAMRLSKILGFADNDIGSLAKLFLEEASTIKEIKEKIGIMFSEKNVLIDYELEFNLIKESIKKAGYFDSFDELKTYISKDVNLSGKKLLKPLRYLLTGSENGPNLSDIYPFIKNYLGDIIK